MAYRINSSGATGDNRFKDTPAPATRLPAAFMNMLMDEVANVVENPLGGNEALNEGDNGQMLRAIRHIIATALPVSITPGEKSVTLGGFIIKLGTVLGGFAEQTVYTPFPTPFPNACWGAIPVTRNDAAYPTDRYRNLTAQAKGDPTVNGFYTLLQWEGRGETENFIDGFTWVAFGI